MESGLSLFAVDCEVGEGASDGISDNTIGSIVQVGKSMRMDILPGDQELGSLWWNPIPEDSETATLFQQRYAPE